MHSLSYEVCLIGLIFLPYPCLFFLTHSIFYPFKILTHFSFHIVPFWFNSLFSRYLYWWYDKQLKPLICYPKSWCETYFTVVDKWTLYYTISCSLHQVFKCWELLMKRKFAFTWIKESKWKRRPWASVPRPALCSCSPAAAWTGPCGWGRVWARVRWEVCCCGTDDQLDAEKGCGQGVGPVA